MNGIEETANDDKKRNKKHPKLPNILEPGFVAPDGGWGWMIVIAAGFSNLFTLALMLSYGLIFRDHFQQLGINASQTTTILNISSAVMSCVGLVNGPLFRKYSYRQVACTGGLVCALSICALSFMKTFYGVLIFYSFLYATGNSLAMSSCALALNTYFKKKRRKAVGLAWTCTGLGPIFVPQLVALLLSVYDVSGTVLVFGGITLNAVACALLLQPVSRHARKESECQGFKAPAVTECFEENDKEVNDTFINESTESLSMNNIRQRSKFSDGIERRSSHLFGSQYLYYDDEEQGAIGLDVIAVGTPMMSRANDGWFSKLNTSNVSLASIKAVKREYTRRTRSRPTSGISNRQSTLLASCRQNNEVDDGVRRNSNQANVAPRTAALNQSCENTNKDEIQNTGDNGTLISGDNATVSLLGHHTSKNLNNYDKEKATKKSWYMRPLYAIRVFFDLDLLQDPAFVNLMMGVTLAHFADINFFMLTPFVLSEHGLRNIDVANIMSVLAIVDVFTRLMIPLIATRIEWENRTFYIIAMALLTTGRFLLGYMRSYNALMATAVFIGFGKAFRTVFGALVIPTYVPLERLPAATGIQLASSGIIYLTFGPIVGWIRDTCGSYAITLYCLNLFPCLVMTSWIFELCYCSMKRKR